MTVTLRRTAAGAAATFASLIAWGFWPTDAVCPRGTKLCGESKLIMVCSSQCDKVKVPGQVRVKSGSNVTLVSKVTGQTLATKKKLQKLQ